MRTTLTLDDDVAALLQRLSRERRRAFKHIVNDALRAGLAILAAQPPARRRRYRLKPVSLGRPRLPNLDNIAEVLRDRRGGAAPVILVDANLLLYATITDYSQHPDARQWLEAQLNAPARVGLPWVSLLAFLRIATNARLFPRPLAIGDAWSRVAEWLALPNVWVPTETDRHATILEDLLIQTASSAELVSDAHLAALAIGHGLTLCSTDRDFSRFHGVRRENPLAG